MQTDTPSVRKIESDIPQSVENIVLKATAKDPFHRYDSVEDMEEDLRTALNPERMNELKVCIPIDDEATKAIPVITNDKSVQSMDETIIHKTDKQNSAGKNAPKGNDNKKRRKKWPIILISTFAALIILGILVITVLPNLISAKDVKIPDVSGLKLDEAVTSLVSKGFVIDKTKDIPNDKIAVGKVIRTEPTAGTTAKEGSKITIYKSSGKAKYTITDYTGQQYDDVLTLLGSKDFKDIKKKDVYDESDPGTIISQDPPAGEKVTPENTVITFKVSKGQQKIILKDLTVYNSNAAQDYAHSAGLTIDASQEQYSDTIPEGMVITQSPASGTEMQKGDKITVVISKGKEEKPPKTITKDLSIPYEPTVPGAPQIVQIYIGDMNRSISEPIDSAPITVTQTYRRQIELTIEEGKTAEYKVVRDGKVYMDETIDYNSVP